MWNSFRFLVKEDFKIRYPGWTAILGEVIAQVMGLTIYWYTAKAFGQKMSFSPQDYANDYFAYLFIGEMTLLIPLTVLEGITRQLKDDVHQGILDAVVVQPLPSENYVLLRGLVILPRECLRVIFSWILVAMLFGLTFHWSGILGAILLQAAALPFFFGIGFLAASCFLITGRGNKVLSFISLGTSMLVGAYFPISVFPESIQKLNGIASPPFLLLQQTRAVLAGDWNGLATWGILLIGGIVTFLLGYGSLRLAFRLYRRRNEPLLPVL